MEISVDASLFNPIGKNGKPENAKYKKSESRKA